LKLLLDTHAFIWFAGENTRLSPVARTALNDPDNVLWLSDASVWEMAIKVQLGKLKFPQPFDTKIFEALHRTQVNILPISTRHVAAISTLPLLHRDPFDRILVVQTQAENCTFVTHDPLIPPYGIPILW
jgi:PIN domain nuclease of toxin-antitoxin system